MFSHLSKLFFPFPFERHACGGRSKSWRASINKRSFKVFKGTFNKYVDKMRGEGVKQWQNSVHIVVECPLNRIFSLLNSKNWWSQ